MRGLVRIATPKQIAKFAGTKSSDIGYHQAIANLTNQGYDFGKLSHFLVYTCESYQGIGRNIFLTVVREPDYSVFRAYDYGDEVENLEFVVGMYFNSLDKTIPIGVPKDHVSERLLSSPEIIEQQMRGIQGRKSPYTMLTFPDGIERLEKVVRAIAGDKYKIEIVKRPK